MKHLIVSLKTSDEVFSDFKKAFRATSRAKKVKSPHYEISFDNKKDFDRFLNNLSILKYVLIFKPKSVYELAKITKMDVSNLNKVILFLEEVGAIKVITSMVSGRSVKTPVVEYDTIEFNLAA
jgi:predicted transcriptional regulator